MLLVSTFCRSFSGLVFYYLEFLCVSLCLSYRLTMCCIDFLVAFLNFFDPLVECGISGLCNSYALV